MKTLAEQDIRARKNRLIYIHTDIWPDVLRQWSEYRRVRRETISLSAFINLLVKMPLLREQVLNKLSPNLNFVGIMQNDMVIFDIAEDKMFRVKRVDGSIKCVEDQSDNCKHIMFARTANELTQLFTDFKLSGLTASDHRTVKELQLKREKSLTSHKPKA